MHLTVNLTMVKPLTLMLRNHIQTNVKRAKRLKQAVNYVVTTAEWLVLSLMKMARSQIHLCLNRKRNLSLTKP